MASAKTDLAGIQDLANQFFNRFAGLDRGHGKSTVGVGQSPGGKTEANCETIRSGPTKLLWEKHLEGEIGLGIFPLRDDATCSWGAIDIDVYDGLDHSALERKIALLGLPLLVCRSKSGGAHCYLFMSEPVDATLIQAKLTEWAAALGHSGVEVFPKQTKLASKKEFGNWLNMPYQDGNRSVRYGIGEDGKRITPAAFLDLADARAISGAELENIASPKKPNSQVKEAASGPIPEGKRHATLVSKAGKFRTISLEHEDIEIALLNINGQFCVPPMEAKEVRQIVKSVCKYPAGPQGTPLTDTGNGLRLVDAYGSDLRYCAVWKKWMIWRGQRWEQDGLHKIFMLAKQTAVEILQETKQALIEGNDQAKAIGNWAFKSQDRTRLEAMVWAAQSELAVTPDVFDRDVMLLNFRNGTLDLGSMNFRNHDRDDLITKMVPVEFDPEAVCPHWESFVDRIMDGDESLVAFLRRAIGYSLTGDVGEQCLFILYGGGANGKSTLIETISKMLDGYACKSEMSSFLEKKNESVSNDIARLKGARFVSAVEAGRGKRLNEPLIKEITGGDTISARFLFREFFDFRPEFKLFLATNARPEIQGVDEAIWRRVYLLPFDVFIPAAERDKGLLKKLEAELPGIMNWALEGCRAWQLQGLAPPGRVLAATAEYRADMDLLADFLLTKCSRGLNEDGLDSSGNELIAPVADVFASYCTWCFENGEDAVQRKTFGTMLRERGIRGENKRINGTVKRVYLGLALRDPAERDMPF